MSLRVAVLSCIFCACTYTVNVTLLGLAKKYPVHYDSQIVLFLAEGLKGLIALVLSWRWEKERRAGNFSPRPVENLTEAQERADEKSGGGYWWNLFLKCLPSSGYALQNYLMFMCLQGGYLSPPHYIMFCNMKIVTTSGLCRVVLGRHITVLQWLSLALLLLGLSTSSLDPESGKSNGSGSGSGYFSFSSQPESGNLFYGLLLVSGISTCSAGAGVVSELLIKKAENMHQTSAELYLVGCVMMVICMECGERSGGEGSLFLNRFQSFWEQHGVHPNDVYYRVVPWETIITWATVCSHCFVGLAVASIFRHGDIIMKIFTTSLATLVTSTLEW